MEIRYSRQAYKYLSKLDKPRFNQVANAINKIQHGERDIKKIRGIDNLYRLRTGDYRVLFTKEYDIIKIEKIGSRGDVYNGLK